MDVFANTILPETVSHFYLLHLDYKFKVLKPDETKRRKSRKKIRREDFVGKFAFAEREFSSSEMLLIPKLPDWYVIPNEVVSICRHAKETTESR